MQQIPEVSVFRFLSNSLRILKNPLPFHHAKFEMLGDTFRLKLGFGNSVVFSRDPGFLQHVLQKNQKNYTKSPIQTKDLAKYVGKGLLTSEGELWQQQRKLIQPAFHKKQLVNLLSSIQSAIDSELSKIKINQPFDVFPVFNDLAFQTVVQALFSNAANQAQINKLQNITEEVQKMLVKELRQPYLNWWFRGSGKIKRHLQYIQEARDILRELVSDRKKSNIRHDDLLDMLLDARYEDGEEMDEEQLIDEILILFTAGHETTSNALTFAALLIASNPESQQQILNEINDFKNDEQSLMENLKSSPYTTSVIEETMRLYPPAYFIDRINIEEDVYSDTQIPKGSNLLFSLYEIHRHKNFWDDPLKFKPSRFLNKQKKTYSSHYFPFGAGPRMCIGNNFAMYEMVMTVQSLVKNYKIDTKETPIEILPLITLKPKNAILVFQKR
ncbi:cytochrome P450 [Patiriisocius marinistellae]|uniref:Cytochrome P450 n=1 Tax=Patiriisocius marinistellae TaxID=2494560 RepID=A0A5J4FYR2_9FLAO|nr:cytochrome P450 [Patiriisocius marinistellae]GEQ85266.1 cytochrome P450 [Patiriisocius marinistellae]